MNFALKIGLYTIKLSIGNFSILNTYKYLDKFQKHEDVQKGNEHKKQCITAQFMRGSCILINESIRS